MRVLFLVGLGLLLVRATAAQAFSPDLAFGAASGSGGRALAEIPGGEFHAVVAQPDGSFVASGSGFTVVRFLHDGSLDSGFGTNGVATAPFTGYSRDARTLVLQPDGAILAAGWTSDCGWTYCPALVRFTPSGAPDLGFGTGSKVLLPATQDQMLMGVVVQPDGRIVVGGFSVYGGELVVARLLQNGQFDPTFGTSGIVRLTPDASAAAYSLRLQPDGKILFAGNGSGNVIVVRLNTDGSRDATFGVNGLAYVDAGGNDFGYSLAVLSSGRLVVVGRTSAYPGDDVLLLRLTSAGTLDPTFGTGGIVKTDLGSTSENARALVAKPDGRLVVTGPSVQNNTKTFVARYLDDGQLDAPYGVGGRILTSFGEADDGRGLTLSGDTVVVAGSSVQQGQRKAALFGYTPSGALNPMFTSARSSTRRLSDPVYHDLVASALAVTPQGRAILGGYAASTTLDLFVAQVEPTGQPAAVGRNGLLFTDRRPSEGLLALTATPAGGYAATGFSGEATQDVLFMTSDGIITTADLGGEDIGAALVRDSSTAYVVGATTTGGVALVRFSPTGERMLSRTFSIGAGATVSDLVRLPGGRLVVAGVRGSESFMLRTLSTLVPDDAFGQNGFMYLSAPGDALTARALVALPDGSLMVGGYSTSSASGNETPFLASVNGSGVPVATFGAGGIQRLTLSASARLHDLGLLPDGSFVGVGHTYGATRDGLVIRVRPNGTLVSADQLQVDQGGADTFVALALDGGRYLYVAGTSGNDATLSRFHLDPSLPVELLTFEGRTEADAVVLLWQTASETNNTGFEIEQQTGAAWRSLAFVPGQGTTAETHQYTQRVTGLAPGTYQFRLKQVDFDGTATYSPVVEVAVGLKAALMLTPATPNPFTHATTLHFGVEHTQFLEAGLYDLLGRRVQTLFSGVAEGGAFQAVRVEGEGLPEGVYVVRLRAANGQQATQRLVLTR